MGPPPHTVVGPLHPTAMYEQSQLKALIDTAVDGILSIDAEGHVRLYNQASERIFRHAREDVLGQRVERLMPEAYAHQHQRWVENYIETGVAKIIGIGRQVEGLRADGTSFPLDLSVGEFRDGDDRHFVGIVRDLSREVAERERARELQAQLELIGRHAAVSEMGAALAHELNQPLTAIDLFLVAAERQLRSDPDKAQALFARVRSEAERAGGIVRRIRQMVERADGQVSVFRLRDAVDAAVELCRIVDRDTRAITLGGIPDAEVLGDETQIRMVLVNLIKNGLDAIGEQNSRQLLVRGSDGHRVSVEVLDNGPGVHPDIETRLFEPFASTKERGLGIGLSICRTIIEGHDGRLVYVPLSEQRDGLGGACFRMELPRAEAGDA